jgi:hypothetical protein
VSDSILTLGFDAPNVGKVTDKDANDLEAVTGNAEDDIGDLVASVRERELLYGEGSLLAVYGGLIAHICSAPKAYKVSRLLELRVKSSTHHSLHTVTSPAGSSGLGDDKIDVRQRPVL